MSDASILDLTFHGNKLVQSADEIGELRRSNDAIDDHDELHRRMDEDGYLFIPGLLDRDEVVEARLQMQPVENGMRRLALIYSGTAAIERACAK